MPWWTPYGFGCLLLAVFVIGIRRRRRFTSVYPSSVGGWAVTPLFLALGVLAIVHSTLALSGRTPPPGTLVDLAFPLKGGTYLVVNGGSHPGINAHMATLDTRVPRFRAFRGQSYAVDIVKIDGLGMRAPGLQPSDPSVYDIYGAAVFAPCAGEIVVAVDGLPDMQVPDTDRTHMAGNHVILRCDGVEILLGHFRLGSIRVATGAQVELGDPIASVGNSGNTNEPHLHIHAQTPGTTNEPMSGEPLPISFSGRFLVRNNRIQVN